MDSTTTKSPKTHLVARTKAGKLSHWTAAVPQGFRAPLCGQARGTRGNGWMFPTGDSTPTCPHCAALTI